MELTAIVQPASLIAKRGCEVGFPGSGFTINTYIKAIGDEVKCQDLLYCLVIVLPPIPCFQVLNPGILFHQSAELEVGCVLIVHGFDVLRG